MDHSELTERLSYYGLQERDPAFKHLSKVIGRAIGGALDGFYRELGTRKELVGKFDNSAALDRARRAQAKHWQSAFDDGLGKSFLERSNHIGGVHARIGLEPRWYVGSYARILDDLITALVAPGLQRFLPWKRAEARRIVALVKVSLLDIDIALSSYFADINGKVNVLNEVLGTSLAELARGRLNIAAVDLPQEYAKVGKDFNSTVSALHQTVSTVVEGVEAITNGSSEIRGASDDLSRRTEQQAANLEETAAAVTQAAQRVRETRDATSKARGTIQDTNSKAIDGSRIVAEAGRAMSQIEQSSGEITSIIGVIDSIAFQTNLLALNAGVEAARAGESGKGFAVVASEVRALAQRCSEAADEIKALIMDTSAHVSSGVDLVKQTGQSFEQIAVSVAELTELIEAIASATDVQAEGLSQIETAVGDLDKTTQQNAAMAEECTAAAGSLAREADNLRATVSAFEVDNRLSASTPVLSRDRWRGGAKNAPRAAAKTPIRGNLALQTSTDDWSEF